MNWWEHTTTRIEVAHYIDDHDGFDRPADTIDYFDKPQRWHDWYRRWAESQLLDALALAEEHAA